MSMNLANLPGIGKIEDPRPEHYRIALAFLARGEKQPPNWEACGVGSLRWRLAATLRRIEWQRAGRQAARAAA